MKRHIHRRLGSVTRLTAHCSLLINRFLDPCEMTPEHIIPGLQHQPIREGCGIVQSVGYWSDSCYLNRSPFSFNLGRFHIIN
jgi:hypothetical protein